MKRINPPEWWVGGQHSGRVGRCVGLWGMVVVTVMLINLPKVVVAQSAAVDDGSATLGRLFTTRAERKMIDTNRNRPVSKQKSPQDGIVLNGLVIRSAGPPAVWVDGRLDSGEKVFPQEECFDHCQNGVWVRIPDTRRRVSLKVGQRFDGSTGLVLEPYQPAVE